MCFFYFIFINKMHFLFLSWLSWAHFKCCHVFESPNLLFTNVTKKIQPSGYDAV